MIWKIIDWLSILGIIYLWLARIRYLLWLMGSIGRSFLIWINSLIFRGLCPLDWKLCFCWNSKSLIYQAISIIQKIPLTSHQTIIAINKIILTISKIMLTINKIATQIIRINKRNRTNKIKNNRINKNNIIINRTNKTKRVI